MSSIAAQSPPAEPAGPHYVQSSALPVNTEGGAEAVEADVSWWLLISAYPVPI